MVNTYERAQFEADVRRCAILLGQQGVSELGRLYDLTAPRLLRYAIALTSSRDDAEDVLQTALVRIVRKPRLLVEARRPWPYILKVVRNEALSLRRKKPPMTSVETLLEAFGQSDPPIKRDLNELVRQAVKKLPPAQSEVVLLKIWEQMTFAEIAEVLDESPNTAASRYRYALEKLALHLHPLRYEVSHD